ncbi:hypothetical protein L228DRAFT_251593 [Xylona heveae TC161]|uniref:Prion-inhibition and propagation HeLo domain-containing protein n=1 Tax=Xylona heveae (strain CBS 132557 / TC161) TaxID=1328760 RepID=A0A164ZFF9_XYLHT|nr:hypothetical protein L228DRAFT_251593 [Xylona heveae TC161]KZF19035.1 hypothetical protein L228DRAFT_251593 [Xylona heveae TC161]
MADGLNDTRAMRVAEIMNEFRVLQLRIAQIKVYPTAAEYQEEGYVILRQCSSEGQSLLSAPFSAAAGSGSGGSGEQEKAQLRRIIVDASARRFKAQKIYLRATAAMRWINSRNAVLQGQKPHAGHAASLRAIDATLRAELNGISDERVLTDIRSADHQNGRWIQEDPPLQSILAWLRNLR